MSDALAEKAARRALVELRDVRWRAARAALVLRLRLLALERGAQVDVEIAPDVIVLGRVTVEVKHGARARLRINGGGVWEGGVHVELQDGGDLQVDEGVTVRSGTKLIVGGLLHLGEATLLSWSCGSLQRAHTHRRRRCGPRRHILDLRHFFDGVNRQSENIETRPVHVGRDTFVATQAVLLPGAHVSEHSIVASGAVVSGRHPRGGLLIGSPARWQPLPGHLDRVAAP